MQVSASAWMSLVMSAFLGFMALTVVLATFYVMRSWSVWLGRAQGRRLPAELGFGGAGFPGQVCQLSQQMSQAKLCTVLFLDLARRVCLVKVHCCIVVPAV